MSTTSGLAITLAITWVVAVGLYLYALNLRFSDFAWWRGKKRVRVRWWEMPSPLLRRFQRRHREMAEHKLTLSREWRRTHRDSGDAA